MKDLPYNLSLENAKVIEVEDGTAFQGKHIYLSNHFPCTIKYQDKVFNSSEQEYQYKRAIENNEGGVARRIYVEKDLKEITKLSKLIKDSPEWKKEVPTMACIIKRKFDQNPVLKAKLCPTKGHLYEATPHPTYGCGFTLAQSLLIKNTALTAGNKLGEKLEELRDSYTTDNN